MAALRSRCATVGRSVSRCAAARLPRALPGGLCAARGVVVGERAQVAARVSQERAERGRRVCRPAVEQPAVERRRRAASCRSVAVVRQGVSLRWPHTYQKKSSNKERWLMSPADLLRTLSLGDAQPPAEASSNFIKYRTKRASFSLTAVPCPAVRRFGTACALPLGLQTLSSCRPITTYTEPNHPHANSSHPHMLPGRPAYSA
jgi:hypothetical protein